MNKQKEKEEFYKFIFSFYFSVLSAFSMCLAGFLLGYNQSEINIYILGFFLILFVFFTYNFTKRLYLLEKLVLGEKK